MRPSSCQRLDTGVKRPPSVFGVKGQFAQSEAELVPESQV